VTVLHHLAQAAAVILLVELLVVLIIFLAVAGGLAFGLHWVRGKTDWAFGKANGYLALVPKYTHTGTGLVAKPFILGGGGITRALVTLESVRRQVRQMRKVQATANSPIVAARPVEPDITTVVPVVSETTTALPRVPETTRHS
jgi:hypothetical protein